MAQPGTDTCLRRKGVLCIDPRELALRRKEKLSPERRREIASTAARARWARTEPSRLARFRREKGLTQTELAQRIGISLSEIKRIERQSVKPRWYVWNRLAKALGMSTKDLKGDGV